MGEVWYFSLSLKELVEKWAVLRGSMKLSIEWKMKPELVLDCNPS